MDLRTECRKEEIQSVKRLGELIGYGNIMDIASALWALDLERKHGIKCGMHIPTVEPCLTEEGKEMAKESLDFRLSELKALGF